MIKLQSNGVLKNIPNKDELQLILFILLNTEVDFEFKEQENKVLTALNS